MNADDLKTLSTATTLTKQDLNDKAIAFMRSHLHEQLSSEPCRYYESLGLLISFVDYLGNSGSDCDVVTCK